MQYFYYFLTSFLLAIILTPLVRKFALANKIVDQPSARRINTLPIARLGGVAIFGAFWLTILLVYIINPSQLSFVSNKLLGIDKNFIGVILGSIVLLITGIYDDIKGLKPLTKLLAHFLSAIIVVGFGIRIWWLHNPVTGLDLTLGSVTFLLVPLWIILIINVINWLDGLDGLASGIGLIASIVLFVLSINHEVNQPATALLAIILAGALLGFLPYNFNPAKIFLGDTGSMFIGFMLAIFAIISGGKFATAALVLGFPILDAFWVISRRAFARQPIWQADRRHLHHRFLDVGFSQRQTVLFLWAISGLFGVFALTTQTKQKFIIGLWLVGLMLIIGISLVFIQLKQKK